MTSEASPRNKNNKNQTKGVDLFAFSNLPRLHFITINPNKGLDGKLRINKIGKWSDYLRKYSKNYFIVRESEKCYHFHALASLDKELKFQKNVHFNVQPVSGTSPKYPNFSEMWIAQIERTGELVEQGLLTSEEAGLLADAFIAKKREAYREKQKALRPILKTNKENKLYNIFRYMLKENPTQLFDDYILMYKGTVVPALQLEGESEGLNDDDAPRQCPEDRGIVVRMD